LLLLLAGSATLAVTGLEGAENVYQYGLGVQKLPDVSTHEHSASASTSEHAHADGASDSHEDGAADHDQPTAGATEGTSDGHGHGQSHDDAANVTAIEDSAHPASLVATQLADAIAMGDINSLRAVVAADVVIFESGGIESSLTEYEGHHMPADMAFMKAMSREVISQQVIDSGDSATVVTRSRLHGTYKDKEIDLNSTETLVMRKLHGHWKVVHIHWSSS
jgi:ketosteroid isomerase-like protein